jgi:hypothetical protein
LERRVEIAVLTTEPVPLPGCATTGAGLRAWGLACGLVSRGFEVVVGSPAVDEGAGGAPGAPRAVRMARGAIGAFLDRERPDAVVLQHWGMARDVPELTVPLALDLAGPHLLERRFWGGGDGAADLEEKLSAMRRADFALCSGEIQRLYFLRFLEMADWDMSAGEVLPVIPFSVPPPHAWSDERHATGGEGEVCFVYGGAFLAWQDPSGPIGWLLDEMDRAGRGRLVFHGGAHPVIDASAGRFAGLLGMLKAHPRVEMRGFVPFDDLAAQYRGLSGNTGTGAVALDLMARNEERELAFTTRTMIYLWCGLPVIYNDYSEVSAIVRERGCGWALSPTDETGFRNVVRQVLEGRAPLAEMSARARETAADYCWDKTIGPLAEWCANPKVRAGRVESLLRWEAERRAAGAHEDTTVGTPDKRGVARTAKAVVRSVAPLLAPVAWLAAWPPALWAWWRLRPGCNSIPRG